jgi:ankyrin repeat protein
MTLREAIRAGDPTVVAAMIAAGADVCYCNKDGYDALLDAVHGRDVLRDPRLPELLDLLVRHGVNLSGVSSYKESGLRVLSRIGRFDAVEFLLKYGADADQLQWNPLTKAVALGTIDEVADLLQDKEFLEDRDWWERTPWLVAIQTGEFQKAQILRDGGADTEACGRCGKPSLFYAIENHHPPMLRWLLEIGLDPEQTDQFGTTCLVTAVESDDLECVQILLEKGVKVDRVSNDESAIGHVVSREVALCLLQAGADPAGVTDEGRRVLVGLKAESDEAPLKNVSQEEFLRARTRRFGVSNPEVMQEPFWVAMVRSGVCGFTANEILGGPSSFDAGPVWCAKRFGQSLTLLPDGRAVSIGGEHEDHYDPDFCIYNDVFVHEPDGTIRILSYPEAVFPPTDFHSASLVDNTIHIIGALGYGKERSPQTPVYRLDLDTWKIEKVEPTGESPGWIYGHRAILISAKEILVRGGTVVKSVGGKDTHSENALDCVLDLGNMQWRRS